MSDVTEYWIGEGVDYLKLWEAYNRGKEGYINKFRSMDVSLVKIEFSSPSIDEPLFNLEVIYKTLKGLYYDFKKYCLLDPNEFSNAGPLFIYSIERGSGWWHLLIESAYAPQFILSLIWLGLKVCHEPLKIRQTKLEIEKLEEERDAKNRERLENKKTPIEQSNIEKFIQERKPIIENLLSQGLKAVVFEEKITIRFEGTQEIKPSEHDNNQIPPSRY